MIVFGVWTVLIAAFGLSWSYLGWWGILLMGVLLTAFGLWTDKE